MNHKLLRRDVHRQMDFLLRLFLIAVVKRVDHSFAHAHPNPVAHLFIKACRFRHAQAHLFRQVYAFDLRIKNNCQVLVVLRHLSVTRETAVFEALYG